MPIKPPEKLQKLRGSGASLPVEWFTRVWTLQEFLLASNPIFICGFTIIRWQRLRYFSHFVSQQDSLGRIFLPIDIFSTIAAKILFDAFEKGKDVLNTSEFISEQNVYEIDSRKRKKFKPLSNKLIGQAK